MGHRQELTRVGKININRKSSPKTSSKKDAEKEAKPKSEKSTNQTFLMAHKKGTGSTRNGRDSNSKIGSKSVRRREGNCWINFNSTKRYIIFARNQCWQR